MDRAAPQTPLGDRSPAGCAALSDCISVGSRPRLPALPSTSTVVRGSNIRPETARGSLPQTRSAHSTGPARVYSSRIVSHFNAPPRTVASALKAQVHTWFRCVALVGKPIGTPRRTILRLVVAQDVIVVAEDYGTEQGRWVIARVEAGETLVALAERIVGRVAAEPIADPRQPGKVLVAVHQEID